MKLTYEEYYPSLLTKEKELLIIEKMSKIGIAVDFKYHTGCTTIILTSTDQCDITESWTHSILAIGIELGKILQGKIK